MCVSLGPKHSKLINHVEIIERFLNKFLLSLIIVVLNSSEDKNNFRLEKILPIHKVFVL